MSCVRSCRPFVDFISSADLVGAFKILTGKPTRKRPLGRRRRRWEDNIRKDLEEIGINARNLVELAQNMSVALNLRVS